MNIGIISYDFLPLIGGQGRYVHDVYVRLKRNPDFRIFVFSPAPSTSPNHIKTAAFSRKFGQNLAFSLVVNKNINKWVKEYKLDSVHFQGGPGGVFLFRKLNIPTVYTAHHTYYQQCRLVPGQRWKWIFCQPEHEGYRIADSVICVSNDTKQVLVEKYHIRPEKVVLIPDGVDTGRLHPDETIKRIRNSILFVGRLEKRKGIDFLVKAIPLVKKEIPDIKLFVIGRGKLREEIQKFSQSNNLEANIQFLGFVPDEDLVKWYNQVQLVVVPSIFEGFGMIAIEAMACATPVIGTMVPGLRDIIEDGKNGLLVEYGNYEALSKAIVELLRNEGLREKISLEGNITVEKKFSWEAIVKAIENVYFHLG